ncbi:hypothetical protein V8E51_019605 [Hyaloscypha variabilis]
MTDLLKQLFAFAKLCVQLFGFGLHCVKSVVADSVELLIESDFRCPVFSQKFFNSSPNCKVCFLTPSEIIVFILKL